MCDEHGRFHHSVWEVDGMWLLQAILILRLTIDASALRLTVQQRIRSASTLVPFVALRVWVVWFVS